MTAIVILDCNTGDIVVAGDVEVFTVENGGNPIPVQTNNDFQRFTQLMGDFPLTHLDLKPSPDQLRAMAEKNDGRPILKAV
jgi:hypothetical protein